MTDDYSSNPSLVRLVDDVPVTPKHSSNARKARLTGLSIASLRTNIGDGKIYSKIEKYNREYNELKRLAEEVNQERKNASTLGEYSDVVESIAQYNKQAKRLAKIGVQVLALDEDIKKIGMAKSQVARAIKVPPFLIGPLKMLSKAGREQVKKENDAKVERKAIEQEMFNSIVSTAKEAVDQDPYGKIDIDKMNSLELGNMVADVKNDLLQGLEEKDNKGDDSLGIRKGKSGDAVEPVATEQATNNNKPETESVVDSQQAPAEQTEEEKRKMVNDAIAAAFEKRRKENANPNNEIKLSSEDAQGMFRNIRNLCSGDFYVERVFDGEKEQVQLCTKLKSGKVKKLTPEIVAGLFNLTEGDNSKFYGHIVDLVELSTLWKNSVVKYENSIGNTKLDASSLETFDDKYSGAFNGLILSVNDGVPKDSIISVFEQFDREHVGLVKNCLDGNGYDVFAKAINAYCSLNNLLAIEKKREEVEEAVGEVAVSKYNLQKPDNHDLDEPTIPSVDVPAPDNVEVAANDDVVSTTDEEKSSETVTEENSEKEPELPTVDDTVEKEIDEPVAAVEESADEKNDSVVENADEQKHGDEYFNRIRELQEQLAEVVKSKDDQEIARILAELNDVAVKGIVDYDADVVEEPKVNVEQPVEIPVAPVVEPRVENVENEINEEEKQDDSFASDLKMADKWAALMSDPDSEEAKRVLSRGDFSDKDVEGMHKWVNDIFYEANLRDTKQSHEKIGLQNRLESQRKRAEIVTDAKVYALSEVFDIDYDSLVETSKAEDGDKAIAAIIDSYKSRDPNGYIWNVDNFADKLANTMGDSSKEDNNKDKDYYRDVINKLFDGDSEYEAAREIMNVARKLSVKDDASKTM